jgi:hypothetical protein
MSNLTSKPLGRFLVGLALKLVVMVSSGLTSKSDATIFSSLVSKLVEMISPDLTSKPMVSFLVEPQNQGGGGFFGLDLKTRSSDLVIWVSKSPRRFLGLVLKTKWASRSSGLLRVEASLARVFQSGLKTGGGATAGVARGTIAKVASDAS